jgi:dual specificity protein kinase YAK1
MNNRTAFVDFVSGLLNLDPIKRWSPQQARMHPFVLGEPLKKPFVPPMVLKSADGASSNTQQQQQQGQGGEPKRYGGLPPAPQRSAGRTYDAASYSQHLAQQQAYTSQSNAYRQPQYSTNPYADPPLKDPGVYRSHAQGGAAAPSSSSSSSSAQAYGHHARVSTGAAGLSPAGVAIANPPAAHYHPTNRGRSLTINQMDSVPPQIQKLGIDLSSMGGQSVTPILQRADQQEAWDRRHAGGGGGGGAGTGGQGLGRRMSQHRHHPQLDLLMDQADSWTMAGLGHQPQQHKHQPPGAGGYAYYPPQQPSQQAFAVVVDGQQQHDAAAAAAARGGGGGPPRFDASASVSIAAPPQAYSATSVGTGPGSAPTSRYLPYAPTAQNPQQIPSSSTGVASGPSSDNSSPYNVAVDSYDHRDGFASMLYTPLVPSQRAPQPPQPQPSSNAKAGGAAVGGMQPQQQQPSASFYSPSLTSNPYGSGAAPLASSSSQQQQQQMASRQLRQLRSQRSHGGLGEWDA